MAETRLQTMSPEMEQCAIDCLNCHSICLRTIRSSLERGGKYAEFSHISLLLNCAEICQTTENFLLYDSNFMESMTQLCAEVCEQCAKNSDMYADDPQNSACAEACRTCAQSCRQITMKKAA